MVDFRAALDVLEPARWIEERPLDEGAAAFSDLTSGRTAAAKILLYA